MLINGLWFLLGLSFSGIKANIPVQIFFCVSDTMSTNVLNYVKACRKTWNNTTQNELWYIFSYKKCAWLKNKNFFEIFWCALNQKIKRWQNYDFEICLSWLMSSKLTIIEYSKLESHVDGYENHKLKLIDFIYFHGSMNIHMILRQKSLFTSSMFYHDYFIANRVLVWI